MMSEQEHSMKLSASTPRVTRSPIPERGQAIVMDGDMFEDGRQRIVVGYGVTPEDAQDLGRILDARDDEQERLDTLLASINAVMANAQDHKNGGAECRDGAQHPLMEWCHCGYQHKGQDHADESAEKCCARWQDATHSHWCQITGPHAEHLCWVCGEEPGMNHTNGSTT